MSNEYSSREKSLKYLIINIKVNCMFQTYIQNTNTHASYINMYFVYSYIAIRSSGSRLKCKKSPWRWLMFSCSVTTSVLWECYESNYVSEPWKNFKFVATFHVWIQIQSPDLKHRRRQSYSNGDRKFFCWRPWKSFTRTNILISY